MQEATATATVTAREYSHDEHNLHALYIVKSPLYFAVVCNYGKKVTGQVVEQIAAHHSTTLAQLIEDGGLTAHPRTGVYGLAHLFEALGY